MSDSVNFEALAQGLAAAGVAHSPSELHGVITGLLATGHGGHDPELMGVLAAHADLDGHFDAAVSEQLLALRDATLKGMDGTGLDLMLMLPGDEEDLGLRVAALGQWCEGFLVGFGTGSANTKDKDLSPGIQEALSDLAAISQVETPDDDGDDQEDMLEQVADHCRMAALMIFTELVMRHRDKPAPPTDMTPPTRH
ncbi:hypothetical protein A11A3_15287 [Alcanivorax hongdengensis A-11-3]|uniref:Uncharacterized protein n=1 Tax=Alcanivorax hongdengensis A-11-3 TaxID=1177179 RepID=L0WAK8_9GAMM|nr:UPF0149 family protein [Alcanivorax hongdengensis]EKF73127.1 hypothetical protein A11A3_15287 [Alcanivorax hongdengensis A-11-3]